MHGCGDPGATDLTGAPGGAVEAVEALLNRSLVEDCVDIAAGEILPLVVVTDDGPAMTSLAVTLWFAARSHLTRVRTRYRAPHTTGVVDRWSETLKDERLYRHESADGLEVVDHVADFTDGYDTIRPHQAHDQTPPRTAYLQVRTPRSEAAREWANGLAQDNTGRCAAVVPIC